MNKDKPAKLVHGAPVSHHRTLSGSAPDCPPHVLITAGRGPFIARPPGKAEPCQGRWARLEELWEHRDADCQGQGKAQPQVCPAHLTPHLLTPACLGFMPPWDSASLPVPLICQLAEGNGPNDVLKQALQIPREQIMPLEEGERFSSQLSKLEFRKLQILGRR